MVDEVDNDEGYEGNNGAVVDVGGKDTTQNNEEDYFFSGGSQEK